MFVLRRRGEGVYLDRRAAQGHVRLVDDAAAGVVVVVVVVVATM